jgi:endonuclease YncB( thermonuclease family)
MLDAVDPGAPRAEDKFDRAVAICRTSSVPELGEALARRARRQFWRSRQGRPPAEADAKSAKRGVWQGAFELPSNWRDAHPRQQN